MCASEGKRDRSLSTEVASVTSITNHFHNSSSRRPLTSSEYCTPVRKCAAVVNHAECPRVKFYSVFKNRVFSERDFNDRSSRVTNLACKYLGN